MLRSLCFALLAAAAVAVDPVLYIFSPECYDTLLVKFDIMGFLVPECLKFTISKGLGYAIIVGALILKVPQIKNILSSGSVEGLATGTFYADVLTFFVGSLYSFKQGYPISTYGEELVILTQNLALVLLMWKYREFSALHKVSVLGIFCGMAFYGLQLDAAHPIIQALPNITICTTVLARAPQVVANYQNGSTGQLSLVTTVLNSLGSVARVFTTLQELDDFKKLMGYVVSLSLNVMLILQMVMYWTATNAATKASKKASKKSE